MIDAVLLDWEGLLVSTEPLRRRALAGALAAEGVTAPTAALAHAATLSTRAAAALLVRASGRDDPVLADLVAARTERAITAGLAEGMVLSAGAQSALQALGERTRLAVATRASRRETDTFLALSPFDALVRTIVTADDVAQPPPSPLLLEAALDRLARIRPLARERVVALVDGAPGIAAARAAGLRVVAVAVPAHGALDADGALHSLAGVTIEILARVSGVAAAEQRT